MAAFALFDEGGREGVFVPAPRGSVVAFALFDEGGREGVSVPALRGECGGLCCARRGMS